MAEIHFGTDGWRAIIGEDFTNDNLVRVIDAAARVFKEDAVAAGRPADAPGTLIVGHDCRQDAHAYAQLAAEVAAAQSFRVLLTQDYCPTPTLCWSVAQDADAVGGIMLTSYLLNFHAKLWDVVWPSALLVFGIFGLFARFSFFRLGCSLFGLYFLMSNLNFVPFRLGREFLLPVFLLLFGGSLLVDTLRKSKNGTHNSGCFSFHPTRNGSRKKEHCTCTGNFFDCDTAFGENHYTILLPTLGGGSADVSFGSLSVDLQKCEHLGENCTVDLNCAFGELVLIVPGRFRVEPTKSAAFASVSVSGAPDDDAAEVIHVNCDASFGEISIRYV